MSSRSLTFYLFRNGNPSRPQRLKVRKCEIDTIFESKGKTTFYKGQQLCSLDGKPIRKLKDLDGCNFGFVLVCPKEKFVPCDYESEFYSLVPEARKSKARNRSKSPRKSCMKSNSNHSVNAVGRSNSACNERSSNIRKSKCRNSSASSCPINPIKCSSRCPSRCSSACQDRKKTKTPPHFHCVTKENFPCCDDDSSPFTSDDDFEEPRKKKGFLCCGGTESNTSIIRPKSSENCANVKRNQTCPADMKKAQEQARKANELEKKRQKLYGNRNFEKSNCEKLKDRQKSLSKKEREKLDVKYRKAKSKYLEKRRKMQRKLIKLLEKEIPN